VTLTLNQPWSNLSTAHRLIILDICAKLFENPNRGSKDIERTQNTVIQCLILDCDLDLERPWSNIGTAHCLIILDICAKLFVNPTRGSKDIERTRNTVIQCLILNCDLEPTLVKHRHCTLSHHTWHLCKVICKSHQGFKRYRADTKVWRTDGQTDNGAKKHYVSPFHRGRHNSSMELVAFVIWYK